MWRCFPRRDARLYSTRRCSRPRPPVPRRAPKFRLERAAFLADTTIQNLARYRMRSIPAAGALLREEDRGERQMTLLDGAEENTK